MSIGEGFENMEYIWSLEKVELAKLAAAQRLEGLGLIVPRGEPCPEPKKKSCGSVFGSSLASQPTCPYHWNDCTFSLPRVFVLLVEFLEDHVCDEGLFRKAGSVSRQRVIRNLLDCPAPSLPAECNAHDVASILKQLLRQLPHPLLPAHYWPLLEACVTTMPPEEQTQCLLLSCLLLPTIHLQCLCVVMKLLSQVSRGAGHSLMDAGNLAVVMAPNLLPAGTCSSAIHTNPLKIQTMIVKTLISSADELGRVPNEVGVAASNLQSYPHVSETRSLDDVLNDCNHKQKKQRTSSLSGLILGLGNRLKRNRGTGGGGDTLSRPAKRIKGDESKKVDNVSEGVSYGGMLTPLLIGRGFRKEAAGIVGERCPLKAFPCLDTLGDGEDSTDAADHGDHTPSQTPPPPTPLLHNHLHSAKLRHCKLQLKPDNSKSPPVLFNHVASNTSNPLPSIPSPNISSITYGRNEKEEEVTDHTFLLPSSSTPVSGHGNINESEDVFGEVVRVGGATDSPNLLDKIQSEMVRRHRFRLAPASGLLTQHSTRGTESCEGAGGVVTTPTSSRESQEASEVVPAETSITRRRGPSQLTHYSATLGMAFGDLPRRKLRGVVKECGEEAAPSSTLHPSSPSLHSASLGIALPCEGVRGNRRRRRRGRGGGHTLKENLSNNGSHDLTLTPPPILKILESNAKRPPLQDKLATGARSISQGQAPENQENSGPARFFNSQEAPVEPLHSSRANGDTPKPVFGALASTKPPEHPATNVRNPGPLRPLNAPSDDGKTPGPKATPSIGRRFKSPWRWATLGGRVSYTPIKEKGSVSKRAQPYVVDLPRPSLSRYRARGGAMKRSVSSYDSRETHPSMPDALSRPLEWVL